MNTVHTLQRFDALQAERRVAAGRRAARAELLAAAPSPAPASRGRWFRLPGTSSRPTARLRTSAA